MAHVQMPILERRRYGETLRHGTWWLPNVAIVVVLSSFIGYATWAAFQNAHYYFEPYISPFYSPEIYGSSSRSLLGPRPAWFPGWLPFSPALIILPFPALFRFTCYYYRGAYYKAFWADPPSCAVGEPRSSYLGEHSFPLILQNVHRYFLLISLVFLGVLAHDAWKALWFPDPATGATHLGVGVGTLVLATNVVLLTGYTLGCHSVRHVVGGMLDRLSQSPARKVAYDCSSCLNRGHMRWAWSSLFSVALSDLYVRLCATGVITDLRLF